VKNLNLKIAELETQKTLMNKSEDGGALIPVLVVLILLIAIPIGAIGFYEFRKARWDDEVRQMCKKDGGVSVYRKVVLNQDEYKGLGGIQGALPIPAIDDAKRSSYPYFRELHETRIHDSNPKVIRLEMIIKRRSDDLVLGKSVTYLRRGGDIPSGLFNDSSFRCPDHDDLETQTFLVTGLSK
jgi:hypothetical protein